MSSAQTHLARQAAYDIARERVEDAAQRHEHVLDFSDIENLSQLPPLTDLDRLVWLGLDGTQISDLTPLTRSTSLEWLTFDSTQVTDLTPLANLASLHELSFANTRVSDIAPLAKLTLLKRLVLHATRVADLKPIVHLTQLADGAREDPLLGLDFANCPLTDAILLDYAQLDNPGRTLKTLAYLRTVTPSN
jgi:hypothetical protein